MVDAIWPEFGYGNSHEPLYRVGDILDYSKGLVPITLKPESSDKNQYECYGDPSMRIFPYFNCEMTTISFNNDTISTDTTINACEKIIFDKDNLISNNSKISLSAGEKIIIKGDFIIESGVIFKADCKNINSFRSY